MQFAALLFLIGLVPVGTFHLLMRYVQRKEAEQGIIPPKNSLIPGTAQKHLRMEQFHSMTWGDLIGLSAVWGASLWVLYLCWGAEGPEVGIRIGGAIIGLGAGIGFHKMCLGANHKPDYGFPVSGKASVAGTVHSVFFGLSFAVGTAGLGVLIAFWNELSDVDAVTATWLGGIGFAIWLAAGITDAAVGNFDKLKPLPIPWDTCTKCGSKMVVIVGFAICRPCHQRDGVTGDKTHL